MIGHTTSMKGNTIQDRNELLFARFSLSEVHCCNIEREGNYLKTAALLMFLEQRGWATGTFLFVF